jgi:hypothetical protein
MGFVWLGLLALGLSLCLELWLKRWWLSVPLTLVVYLAYVWLEVNVLPFHRGGFPGWEYALIIGGGFVVLGAVPGVLIARSFRRSAARRENAL